jgi:hypothetical protein
MIKNGFDIIDMMGPDATRSDYEWLATKAQEMADDDEMWDDE